jgi:hypothetical protein
VSARIKRLAVCWWLHRWHRCPYGGWGRRYCQACEDREYGYDRKERVMAEQTRHWEGT